MTPPEEHTLRTLIAQFPRERTWLLPALQTAQRAEGWLSPESLATVALHLRVPQSEVYGVAGHYPEFRLTKPGSRLVRVCTGVSCRIQGGLTLLHALQNRLGLTVGETSQDHSVTLEEADCLFRCAMAPVVEVDHRCYGRLDTDRLDSIFNPPSPRKSLVSAPSLLTSDGDTPKAVLGRLMEQSLTHLPSELRLVVGAGSCSESVGADLLMDRLTEEVKRQGLSATVVEGGCNGMCYAAPIVELYRPDWPRISLKRVTLEHIPLLVSALKADRRPAGIEAVAWQESSWRDISGLDQEPFLRGQHRAVLERCGMVDVNDLADALRQGSYATFGRVLEQGDPLAVINEVKASGLTGRGGAYFGAAHKWEACRNATGSPKYLVINGEEGEPGIFKDRHLMEGDPHRLLEGILLTAFACGASRGILFINGEAELSARRMENALRSAEAVGLLGERILESDFSFQLELRRGSGGFILGEETALMEAIEGKRAMPRPKPPFPVEAGLWGKPTVIHNVETLTAVPLIVSRGAAWFTALGGGRGTKLFGLSGHLARPGIVEVPMRITLRHLIGEIGGGGKDGQTLKAALVGGPSGVIVRSSRFDEPLIPGGTISPGSGGVVALGDSVSIDDVTRTLLTFNAQESCGKCTPCREGTGRLLAILQQSQHSGRRQALEELAEVIRLASLCGLGQSAPLSLLSALDQFPEDIASNPPKISGKG
ncbi:Putative dehydrogenase, similar to gamma (5') and beta (3') subunits of formate dehydrogenase and to nuoE and nuoF of NADH dehydrogenase (fdhB2/C2) [Candidatus Methylomirabilis oxygeniifera]|uniref:Putative dehydrogenase, similar to gamma (5') and beta (3') subunits of formate dehydrogenase and to nuoE and nuoF of NADH dehydrogenase (FdhB2/C2) n=1 Tax=Methylomirabilis oxygeniifera TaxID=671143 RepID=D5MM29_METO1|nr:Putative dehydrogenase, similar to gamma (5') and beta (3') subunits of formate dehydrogenase and to nuoE and nuoF of NADH dehydrogenase (fdhB2/C2) [Candidatus Methylomirabilis oxyfera]